MELMGCQGLSVPNEVMHHVVQVESAFNPYAIGVVGGRLVRQPRNLPEALATVRMLEGRGFNFSLGLAQVNRYNLGKYGIDSYEKAFEPCTNLTAGSKILAECYHRASGDWGKSFSCYYSGNFSTGFRHGYVQKIYASLRQGRAADVDSGSPAIEVVGRAARRSVPVSRFPLYPPGSSGADGPSAPAAGTGVASAAAAPARPSRAEPVPSRFESVVASAEASAPPQMPEEPMPVPATAVLRAVPTPVSAAPTMAAPVPMGRAVPTGSVAGPARAVVADAAQAPDAAAPKRRERGSDKAFVISDPKQDDAFVF